MQELINQITEAIEGIQDDVVKFDEKGNKAAGTRVRKAMQVIKGGKRNLNSQKFFNILKRHLKS